MTKLESASDLEKLRKRILSKVDPKKSCVIICAGTGCKASGCDKVSIAFREELDKQSLTDKVDVRTTGCPGFCERGPIVVIQPEGIFYQLVEAKDVGEIISETVRKKKVIDRLLYTDPQTGKKIVHEKEVPFYAKQKRILLDSNSLIDPVKIEDYLAIGGYSALAKVLFKMKPEQVIDTIKQSGLRGRGGAGFPTGVKWESCRNAKGDPKYVICNADEGDPGAFANRGLLEGNPHSILEGMLIGAYGIGSTEGFVYVRQEYPLAVENLEIAIRQAEEYGLLGENILGSGFNFKITIHRGAGAFVSGESSALMTAIEGRVGEPQPKYIHTVVKGVYGKPSCLNNVETWATVPAIINNGVDWFNSIGTKGSKGTKIFSLVGKVNNTGLVEVPMGMTLREIIYGLGGGIPNGKKFKAVQTGGPSGGCIPEKYLDLPVDFDELTKVGSMMGSGGMIVMDEDTCMVDTAKYFANFLADESCGKCIPCREGLKQVCKILDKIAGGKGTEDDIKTLEDLAEVLRDASLCSLGQTAANPVLSTLKYFRDEYEAHINGECPAKVCKALVTYYIDPEKCTACGLCLKNCTVGAISGKKGTVHIIDQKKCIKCDTCYDVCPDKFNAVRKISGEPVPSPVAPGTEIKRKR
jgi:NADP-reducing hydrogenase subunit HndC